MRTTDLTPSPCWSCGYVIDAATGVGNDNAPKAGDVSICLRCGALGVYADGPAGLVVRKPTDEEFDVMAHDDTLNGYLLAHREWAEAQGWF